MAMSTYVVGVRDLDGKFAAMIAVKLACEAAKVDYPAEVKAYFKSHGENVEYLRDKMELIDIDVAVNRSKIEMQDIYQVAIDKLPPDVTSIRFINSW